MTQPSQYPGPFYPQQQSAPYPEYQTLAPATAPMSARKKGLILVSAALGLFLVTFLTIGIVNLSSRPDPGTAPGQSASAPRSNGPAGSDEKQIRQTIAGMAAAAKANDYKKMASYFCAKYRTILDAVGDGAAPPDISSLTKPRNGPASITRIDVDGDDAVVHITDSAGDHSIQFKRESGAWKFCPVMK